MSKRFYIILFCVLSVSLVLLGFSYSKESGSNEYIGSLESKNNEFRIVYSNNKIDTKENNEVYFSLVNKNHETKKYYLVLEETDNKKVEEIYYTINDSEREKLENNQIYLGELKAYGNDGDQQTFNIKIFNTSSVDYEFEMKIKNDDIVNLDKKIILGNNVYVDKKGNYRYYGEKVNNYIKYNGNVGRIVGYIDEKIRIISEPVQEGMYEVTNNYITLEDFILSFNENEINMYNVLDYKSWMISDNDYWFNDSNENEAYIFSDDEGIKLNSKNDSLYIRNVYDIDKHAIIIGGDGTINNPYEVSYGS